MENGKAALSYDYQTPIRFTVENNTLVSITCGNSSNLLSASPPSISDGEFSAVGTDGVTITGRFVSSFHASGTIRAPCTSWVEDEWIASKSENKTKRTTARR